MTALSETIWFDVVDTGRSTEKAMLLEIEGKELWIPRSQLRARKKDKDGQVVRAELTRWFATKTGLATTSDAPYVTTADETKLWLATQLVDESFMVYTIQTAGRRFEIPKNVVLARIPATGPIHRLCVKRAWAEENGLLDPKDDL